MRLVQTVAIIAALVGSGVTGVVAHADPAPPAPPAPKTTMDADGIYAVGKDIAPGNYASAGPLENGTCSWRRSDGAGETLDNAITKKSQIVTIAPTDATFRTRGCQSWSPTTDAPPAPVGNLQAQIIVGALGGLTGGQARSAGPASPAPAAPGASAPAAQAPAAQAPAAAPAAPAPAQAPTPDGQASAPPALTAPTPTPAPPAAPAAG